MGQTNLPLFPQPLWVKIMDCLFVIIAVLDFYNSLVLYPVVIIPYLSSWKPIVFIVNAVITFGMLAGVLLFFINWMRRERKGIDDRGLRHAWCLGILRYWIAVEIFNYGFAKLLGTQFAPSYFRGDSTWSSLSGFDLTWNYFGYSYTLSAIIAGVQIIGAALLLTRRTMLLGAILLLPVMINIVLIDIFYKIATGALMNAILFTAGLLYLLALEWPAVVAFLRQTRSALPAIRLKGLKNILRVALAVYAFVFIYLVTMTGQPAGISGKWRVEQLVRNGVKVKPMEWLTDSLAWKNIYLEKYGRATFSPNPYVVETGRAAIGIYRYDEKQKAISFSIHGDNGSATRTYIARLSESSAGHMQWTMTGSQDTVLLTLTKVPVQ